MPPSRHIEPSATQKVILPSIHQLFPEHMMRPSSPEDRRVAQFVKNVEYPNHLAPPFQPSDHRLSLSTDRSQGESHHQVPRTAYDDIRSRRACSPSTRRRSSTSALHFSLPPPRPVDYKFHNYSASGAPLIILSRHEETLQKASSRAACSFDVLRSDPLNTSLEHLVSSKTIPNRGTVTTGHTTAAGIAKGTDPAFKVQLPPSPVPPSLSSPEGSRTPIPTSGQHEEYHSARMINNSYLSDTSRELSSTTLAPPFSTMIAFPVFNTPLLSSSTERNTEQSEESTEDTVGSDDDNMSGGDNGKKHVCTHCLKRFNRPSSLRIHVNTHTGDTPFHCPWPDCGRAFNVNSNMRRHYRNHAAPGFSRSFSKDNRRRRKRTTSGVVFVNHGTMSPSEPRDPKPFLASPAISTVTISESSGDDSNISSPRGIDDNQSDEENEEDELMDADSVHGSDVARQSSPASARVYGIGLAPERPDSGSHPFDERGTSLSSTPLQSSATPRGLYRPSALYADSRGSNHVSTALRPAFMVKGSIGGNLD